MLSLSHNLLARYLDLIDVMPQLLSLCNPFVDIGGGIIADQADTPLYCQKSVKKIRGFQQFPETLTSSLASSIDSKQLVTLNGESPLR